jgi:hypothetical protein
MAGSSKSSSSASTNNIDMRIAADTGSINTSSYVEASGNAVVTMTDSGAVHDAFGFARQVMADAFDSATASQIETSRTVNDALNSVAEAYSDAKQGEQKVLTAVGLGVVAMVAVQALKGK